MANLIKIKYHWKRSSELPFPQIWRRFEVKLPTGAVQKFKIQDLTADRFEEAWEFSLKYFWAEEPVSKSLKMTEDQSLMADIQEMYLNIFQQNLSLIVLTDEPGDGQPILALLVWAARSKNDEILEHLRGPKADRFNKLGHALEEGINVFDELGVDAFLEDWGVSVAPEFRGRQLARNAIMSSDDMARTLGIHGKTVFLTNKHLSSIDKKWKPKLFREIFYDNFRDTDGNIIIPVEEFTSILFYGVKFT